MKKLLLLPILVFILSCESNEESEPDCDLRCAEVTNNTRIIHKGAWTWTRVTAERLCDGKEVSYQQGTRSADIGSIVCRDEFIGD